MTIKSKNPGIHQPLIVQLDKVARHIRQGSFRTKERYYEAMKRFRHFGQKGRIWSVRGFNLFCHLPDGWA